MATSLTNVRPRLGMIDTRRIKQEPKRALHFYFSSEWRALLAEIIAQRGRRCEDPNHDPSPPRDAARIFGDHIRELKDGGEPLDRSNILLRCAACHARKTAAERAGRARTVYI